MTVIYELILHFAFHEYDFFFFFFLRKKTYSHSKEIKSESSFNHRTSPKVTIAKAT
jgi:hypothetical protein